MIKFSDKVAALFCVDALGGIPGPAEHQNAVQALRDWAGGEIAEGNLQQACIAAWDLWAQRAAEAAVDYGWDSSGTKAARRVRDTWGHWCQGQPRLALFTAWSSRRYWTYWAAYGKWGSEAGNNASRFWDEWAENLILLLVDEERDAR